jgi:hypothetical protein
VPVVLESVNIPTDDQRNEQPIKFVSFSYANISGFAAPLNPQSTPNVAGTSFRISFLEFLLDLLTFQPKPRISPARLTIDYPESKAQDFSLYEFYFACVLSVPVTAAFELLPCNATMSGDKVTGGIVSEDVIYSPQKTTTTAGKKDMLRVTLPETFRGLKNVRLELKSGDANGLLTVAQAVTVAMVIDSVSGSYTPKL